MDEREQLAPLLRKDNENDTDIGETDTMAKETDKMASNSIETQNRWLNPHPKCIRISVFKFIVRDYREFRFFSNRYLRFYTLVVGILFFFGCHNYMQELIMNLPGFKVLV